MDILNAVQSKWGTPGKLEASGQQSPVPMPEPEPAPAPSSVLLPALDIDYPGYDPDKPGCSCCECGLKLVGRISDDPERDCARLEELVRQYPIRPHRHEGGGSGFSFPYENGWSAKHDGIVKEFSELWFTAAGDLYLSRHWRKILVVPRDKWNRLVHVDAKTGAAWLA